MNKFDIKASKYTIFVLVVCLVFAGLVMNAYKYIPDNTNLREYVEDFQENIIPESETTEPIEEADNMSEEVQTDREQISDSENGFQQIEDLKPLESNVQKEDLMVKALNLKKEGNYVEAISVLNNLKANTPEVVVEAKCLEEIAHINAINKKYGTALTYAQQSYNLYPTTSVELLLARLYYKTGNTASADKRIEDILKRDFSFDR